MVSMKTYHAHRDAHSEQSQKKRMPVTGWPEKTIRVATCANGYSLYVRNKEGKTDEYLYYNTTTLIVGMITHIEDDLFSPCDVEKIIEDHRNVIAPVRLKLQHMTAQYEYVKKANNDKAARIRDMEKELKARNKEIAELEKKLEKMKKKMK